MSSAVISALQKKRPSPESFLAATLRLSRTAVSPSTRTLAPSHYRKVTILPSFCPSRPSWYPCTQCQQQAGPISKKWRTTSAPSVRASQRGGLRPAPRHQVGTTLTFRLYRQPASFAVTPRKTLLRLASNHFRLPFSDQPRRVRLELHHGVLHSACRSLAVGALMQCSATAISKPVPS
jgi:hypothetical protein